MKGGSKKLTIVLFAVGLLFLLSTRPVAANLFSIGDVLGKAVGTAVFVISYVISWIVGLIVAVEVWVITIILNLNQHIVDSPPVQLGFSVTLSIANLGFVLGIIIVAIATILRLESYGIKQILWKLVVAALLVNFSLTIAGSLLTFANSFTSFFLGIFPGSGPGSGGGLDNFATAIGGAFSPHRGFLINKDPGGFSSTTSTLDALSASANQFASILTPIGGLVFTVLSLTVAVITLATFIIMLIVRYVLVGILLVLMPLAWVTWIFPATSKHWSEWWSTFLRWTFFAPTVMFFMYLSVMTANKMNTLGGTGDALDFTQYTSRASSGVGLLWSAVGDILGNLFSPLVEQLLRVSIVVGLMVGGIFAANKLSITGAGAAMGAFKSMGNTAKGWATARGKQFGTAALRTQTGRNLATGLQQFGAGRGAFLRTLTAPVRLAGRGLQAGAVSGEKLVDESKEKVKGMTMEQAINALTTSSAPARIALLEKIKAAGRLGDVKHLDRYLGDDKEEEFTRFGNKMLYRELRNESGFTLQQMIKDGTALTADGRLSPAAIEHLRKVPNVEQLFQTFFKDFNEKDTKGKLVYEKPFGMDEGQIGQAQRALAEGMARVFTPTAISAGLQKVARGDAMDVFKGAASGLNLRDDEFSKEAVRYFTRGAGARTFGLGLETFTSGPQTPREILEREVERRQGGAEETPA